MSFPRPKKLMICSVVNLQSILLKWRNATKLGSISPEISIVPFTMYLEEEQEGVEAWYEQDEGTLKRLMTSQSP